MIYESISPRGSVETLSCVFLPSLIETVSRLETGVHEILLFLGDVNTVALAESNLAWDFNVGEGVFGTSENSDSDVSICCGI
jgi:hypothetical protein